MWVISVGPSQAVTVIAYAGNTETAAGMYLNSYNAIQVMKTACPKANRDSKSLVTYILNLARAISH